MSYSAICSGWCYARLLLLLYSVFTLVPAHAEPPPTPEFREWLVQVEINRQPQSDTALVMQRSDGEILVSAEEWARWRLRAPPASPTHYLEADYWPLRAVMGLSYRLDVSRLTLAIEVPPHAFLPTVIAEAQQATPSPTADPGLFLNYDGFAEYQAATLRGSALFELGVFNSWGVGVTDFAWRDIGHENEGIRLGTAWVRDFPEYLASLRLGDSVSQPGAWGSAARFGGVQFGTRFATQPRLITQPLGAVHGEARLPSTVDLYLNGMRATRRNVEPGPFSITDLPVVTGQGELRMVVRDILGREQVVIEPFYNARTLLRPGLNDYSLETGLIRRRFGRASLDYGDWMAASTFRHGFTDAFTGEAHAEWEHDRAVNVGIGGDVLLDAYGVGNIAAALSHNRHGEGGLFQVGVQVQPTQRLTIGGRWQWSNGDFIRVGSEQAAPRRQLSASLGYSFGPYGALGLSYVRQDTADRLTTETASGTYSLSLGDWGFLNVTGQAFLGDARDYLLGIGLTVPLGDSGFASARMDQRWGENAEYNRVMAAYTRNAPRGEGIGYRLETDFTDRHIAAFSQNTRHAAYQLTAAVTDGEFGARIGASGGLGWLGGQAFAMRRIEQSFALVHLPDLPNVRVYADNQLIGRTDEDGKLLIPYLRPYDVNPIAIEQRDLPFDTQIEHLKVAVTPYFRSGVVVDFPAKRTHGGLLTLVLEDGSPLPAGATVRVMDGGAVFPVANRGEAYLTGLATENRLRAEWKQQACEFTVTYPQTDDPLPDLGKVICEGVKP